MRQGMKGNRWFLFVTNYCWRLARLPGIVAIIALLATTGSQAQAPAIQNGVNKTLGFSNQDCLNSNSGVVGGLPCLSRNGGNMGGNLSTKGFAETVVTATISVGGTLTIDLSLGTVFVVQNTGDVVSFSVTNFQAAKSSSFVVMISATGTAHTWNWGAVRWSAITGTPVLTTTNGKVDILTFITPDAGTTLFGLVGGYSF